MQEKGAKKKVDQHKKFLSGQKVFCQKFTERFMTFQAKIEQEKLGGRNILGKKILREGIF